MRSAIALLTRDAPPVDLARRELTLGPSTFNAQSRTVEAILSTGADVVRRDFNGEFVERLSIDPSHVDLSALNGANVIDSHRQDGIRQVLGIVENPRIEGGQIRAILRFSAREDVSPILADIGAGIIRHLSIGYQVEQWQESTEGGRRVRTAVKWTPREVSLVAVPADPGAMLRSGAAGQDQQIRNMVAIAGLDTSFADALLRRGATIDAARLEVLDAMRQRSAIPMHTATIRSGYSGDDPELRARWMGEALYQRVNPGHQMSEPARQFAYASMPDLAAECLRRNGIVVTGLSRGTIVTRALHSTSDFPLILGDTVGRTLRAAYQAAPAGIRRVAREASAPDFRTRHRIQLSSAPTLLPVNEHGEYQRGTMAEAEETYRLGTFGRIIGITRQAIVNDDLGAFATLSRRFGTAAAEFENQQLVDLLTSNSGAGPTMSDSVALFHSSHGNLASSGAAIDDTTLSAARLAMRKQTDQAGQRIGIAPRFLIVPPDAETTAEKYLAPLVPAEATNANPFSGKLELVVEARFTNTTAWYLAASPDQIDGLEYCYLEGAPGPQITTRAGFDVDGVETKISLDFGCGFVDWRGWYRNAGTT